MKLPLSLLALAMLSACASGLEQHAGDPPPRDYKAVIAGKFLEQFRGEFSLTNALISQPQPGARDIVNGWRVCVEASPINSGGGPPVQIAYFYVTRHIENVTVGDERCNAASYEPWPELDHAEGWPR